MNTFFVFRKVKIIKIFLKTNKHNRPYYQIYVLDKNKEYKNVFCFENYCKNFSLLNLKDNEEYTITGRILNLFGSKQILSVSKITQLCENNKLVDQKIVYNLGVKN